MSVKVKLSDEPGEKEFSVTQIRNAIKKSITKSASKPKPIKFDSKLLAHNILSKRTKENISFRDVQLSHGIGKAQLWALEIGKAKPSIDTMVAVLSWLGHDANKYFHS